MLANLYMHDMGGGWGVLMTLGWLAVIALGVYGLVAWSRPGRKETSAETLDRRRASGEITIEEHERLRQILFDPTSPPAAV